MDDIDLSSAYAAHDAAEALVALGWPVRPAEDESETWRIGYIVLTDEELIGLATRRGIRPAVEWLQ